MVSRSTSSPAWYVANRRSAARTAAGVWLAPDGEIDVRARGTPTTARRLADPVALPPPASQPDANANGGVVSAGARVPGAPPNSPLKTTG